MTSLTEIQREILIHLLEAQPIMDTELLNDLQSSFPEMTIGHLRDSIIELANGWRYIEAHETQWGYQIKLNSVGELAAKKLADTTEILFNSISLLHNESVLERIIGLGEGENLEFKHRIPDPDQMSKDIAAFANSKGGLIIYGIDDNGEIVGVSEQVDFPKIVREALKEVKPRVDLLSWGLFGYKDRSIWAVLVNPSKTSPFLVDNSFYRRVGATNIKLSEADFITSKEKRSEPEVLELSESKIREFMSIADEDAFTEVLLIPFLRRLGFRSVMGKGHRDKTLEFGQDVRCFKLELPTGHWIYWAAQVKTEDINYSASGKNENVENILTQLKMAIEREMFDAETNTMNLPDHGLLVTTGEINEGARNFLTNTLAREKRRKIFIWEGNYLVERIIKDGLPKGCQIEIKEYLISVAKK
ncbi:MAG: helix-turn-helix domain-containing protein [archaeon]